MIDIKDIGGKKIQTSFQRQAQDVKNKPYIFGGMNTISGDELIFNFFLDEFKYDYHLALRLIIPFVNGYRNT